MAKKVIKKRQNLEATIRITNSLRKDLEELAKRVKNLEEIVIRS